MVNVLQLLSDVAKGTTEFGFVPQAVRDSSATAIQRGIKCILDTQILFNGRRTIWCQQHDALTLQPTSARNYEMPAQATGESAGIMLFLIGLPHPSPGIKGAVQAAAAWFERPNSKTWHSDPSARKEGNWFLRPGPVRYGHGIMKSAATARFSATGTRRFTTMSANFRGSGATVIPGSVRALGGPWRRITLEAGLTEGALRRGRLPE
jgi:hypothetical protein